MNQEIPDVGGGASSRSVPAELAQAAMTAALMGAIAVVSIVVPGVVVFAWLGAVPMGVLCYRFRLRVGFGAFVAAGLIGFLMAGFGGLVAVVTCAYMGAIAGEVKRHGRGAPTMLFVAAVWGVTVSPLCVVVFGALTGLREVVLGVVAANAGGIAALLKGVPGLADAGAGLERVVHTGIVHWPWLIGVGVWLIVVCGTSFGWRVLTPVLRRLEAASDLSSPGLLPITGDGRPPGPLPIMLTDVGYRYPGADRDALAGVSMRVAAGEHVAITGPNGAGKSTLMRILAGVAPTTGTIERPAGVGLGQVAGTALVLQHPDSQVLGLRVGDDLVWGLPPDRQVDTDGLLAEVGLAGMADRDTAGLSGGESQRLAIAAALARDPALLVADEVTTMVDPPGRTTLLEVLDGLTAQHRVGLVHITHYPEEAAAADRAIPIGAATTTGPRTPTRPAASRPSAAASSSRETVLEVCNVSFDYAAGTPWSQPVLREVSFDLQSGDGVLLCGGNGSGKSTLAWIMAGLLTPTTGHCLLDGRPVDRQVGAVAVCFQSARLQLLRGHAGAAIAALAGISTADTDRIVGALASVGLGAEIAGVLIDRLSGGQLRRVALAGLLAHRPRLLILDEPLAGLDTDAQLDLIILLTDIRRRGQTLVVISHDTTSLSSLCPRTLRLEHGTLVDTETSLQP